MQEVAYSVLVGSFALVFPAAASVGFFTKVIGSPQRVDVVQQQAAATRGCHKAFTSETQASPRVDVGDTPVSGTEIEHEGKSVKEPSVPEVLSVFVGSLLGRLSRLWWHYVSSLVSETRRALGFPGTLQLRCGGEGGCR